MFEDAKAVFRAHVTKIELSDYADAWPGSGNRVEFVHVYYDLKETLKGEPEDNGPVTTWNLYVGGCGVPVVVGTDYLFVIDELPIETPPEISNYSSGFISIFGTSELLPIRIKK